MVPVVGVAPINRMGAVDPAPYRIWAVRPGGTKEKAPREAGRVFGFRTMSAQPSGLKENRLMGATPLIVPRINIEHQ